jgi:hypothetical protein
MFYINNNKVQYNYNLSRKGVSDEDLSPRRTGMEKKNVPNKCLWKSLQEFFFHHVDQDRELKTDGEFLVIIPTVT